MNRILALTLTCCLACSLMATAQSISVNISSGGLEAALADKGNCTSLTITGNMDARDFDYINQHLTELTQIDLQGCTIDGYDSRDEQYLGYHSHFGENEIPPSAFFGFTALRTVVLPDNITGIAQGAFAGCEQLTDITLPATLQNIGDYAFSGCTGLTALTFSTALRTIGNYAFDKCSGLARLDLSGCTSLREIGARAFSLNTSATQVQLPASTSRIGDGAFAGCSRLQEVSLPASSVTLGQAVFAQCNALQKVSLQNCNIATLPAWTFANCTALASIELPQSLTDIAEGAFFYCTSLPAISLPAGIGNVGDFAFSGCSSLTAITFMNEGLEQIGRYAFYHNSDADSVNIPSTVAYIGDHAFDGCVDAASFTTLRDIPAELGELVFANMNIEEKSLFVKEESVPIYASTPQWQDFGKIGHYSAEEVVEAPTDRIKTSFEGYTLRIQSTQAMDDVRLYDTTGMLLRHEQPQSTETSLSTAGLTDNIYILYVTTADKRQTAIKIARIIR